MLFLEEKDMVSNIQNLPNSLINPGLLTGGGINRSLNRFSIGLLQAWTLENFEPIKEGLTNRGIGWEKKNHSRGEIGKVQCVFAFEDKICYVKNGNFYYCYKVGSPEQIVQSGAFDSNAKVRYAYNRGSGLNKVYLCDGVNNPKFWDGSTLSDVPNLSTIPNFTAPNTVIEWRGRAIWSFNKGTANESRIVLSRQNDGDTYDFTATSYIDAIDTEVFPGDGDYVVGMGKIRIKNDSGMRELLVACKSKQAYQADDITFADSTISAVFDRVGVDIECINADCIVGFLNDLWILGSTGIKGFSAVANQDGVAALVQSASLPVDSLIQEASASTGFQNAFMVHFSSLRKIWIFLPKNTESSLEMDGFIYPEVPNNYAICYNYGISTSDGRISNIWYTRGGKGWAVASACEDKNEIVLGGYFGDIYGITPFFGNDFHEPLVNYYSFTDTYEDFEGNLIANPTLTQLNTPITSIYETGDWTFENYEQEKRLEEIKFLFLAETRIYANFEFYYNGDSSGVAYLNKPSNSLSPFNVGVWDVSNWDESVWGGDFTQWIRVRPSGHGRSIRTKFYLDSTLQNDDGTDYNNNYISLFGISGNIDMGGKVL